LFIKGEFNRKRILKQRRFSRPVLSSKFSVFFNHPLACGKLWNILPPGISDRNWIYGVDGKWLKRKGVFILHRNITAGINLYWSFWQSESYGALQHDLKKLAMLLYGEKYYPQAAVSDWKGAMVSAVPSYFGPIPHQRCLIHLLRQAKLLLPRKSPYPATLELRAIAKEVIQLKNQADVASWFNRLGRWHDSYGYLLKVKTREEGVKRKWWYTHGSLRRAWRLLSRDTEPFFHHLDNQLLPPSNNSLEGTLSQAVNKLLDHRGMKLERQVSFLSWYFTFSRVKNKQQLKRLWDHWKMKNS